MKASCNDLDEADMVVVCRCGAECFLPADVQEPEKYLGGLLELHQADVDLAELRQITVDYAGALQSWADSGVGADGLVMVDDRAFISALRRVGHDVS